MLVVAMEDVVGEAVLDVVMLGVTEELCEQV